jgi:hypothetical protein
VYDAEYWKGNEQEGKGEFKGKENRGNGEKEKGEYLEEI